MLIVFLKKTDERVDNEKERYQAGKRYKGKGMQKTGKRDVMIRRKSV